MANSFKVKFRRRFIWRTLTVEGNVFLKDQDKMSFQLPDGTQREIPEWSKCEVKVGTDWLEAVKRNIEQQAGHAIPINKKIK